MKLSLRIADPAGNITIFVMTPVPFDEIPAISSRLLQIEEYRAEQVAFAVPPQLGGVGRIQMMGGEFCGNATRSYGYLLSVLSPEQPAQVLTEISGADTPLLVEIDHKKGTCQTQMPLLRRVEQLNYEGVCYSAMVFEGIVHIIVPGKQKAQTFVEGLIATAKAALPCDAYGVMFLDGAQLIPAVYVCDTDSLVWESSCGSGSMACAAYCTLGKPDGEYRYSFHQPGGTIDAVVGLREGRVVLCKMGGPVKLSEEIVIDLSR